MDSDILDQFIAGEDSLDQNDEDVVVTMRDKILHYRHRCGDHADRVVDFYLPHDVCLDALKKLKPIYDQYYGDMEAWEDTRLEQIARREHDPDNDEGQVDW